MYFWNTRRLADEIANGSLSENEWKNYYLATSIFITVSIYFGELSPHSGSITLLLAEAISVISVTIFGIGFTFKSNQGKNGGNYVARVTALSFPILIQIFVVGFLLAVTIVLLSKMHVMDGNFDQVFSFVFTLISQMYFFWRINYLLKIINTSYVCSSPN